MSQSYDDNDKSMATKERAENADSKELQVFDLVAGALDDIDANQRSADKNLLVSAQKNLVEALHLDKRNFDASYLRAMVSYLQGNSEAVSEFEELEEFAAVVQLLQNGNEEEFNNLTWVFEDGRAPKGLVNEVRYNLAAAFYSNERWDEAIKQFEEVTLHAEDDLLLALLARAGSIMARAKRLAADSDAGPESSRDTSRIEEDSAYVRKRLKWNAVRRFVPWKESIDAESVAKIRAIVAKALALVRENTGRARVRA